MLIIAGHLQRSRYSLTRIASYSTISRQWKKAIERIVFRLFSQLRKQYLSVLSTCLGSDSGSPRREYVRRLHYVMQRVRHEDLFHDGSSFPPREFDFQGFPHRWAPGSRSFVNCHQLNSSDPQAVIIASCTSQNSPQHTDWSPW